MWLCGKCGHAGAPDTHRCPTTARSDWATPTAAGHALLTQMHASIALFAHQADEAGERGDFGTECEVNCEGFCTICEITHHLESLAMELDIYIRANKNGRS